MATTEKNLADAFYETLKDVYFAEKQSVKACKKSAKAAKAPEVKDAFAKHAEESAGHVERLVQVFEILGKPARAKTCDAMMGITAEMEEDLEDFGDTARWRRCHHWLRSSDRALRNGALWPVEDLGDAAWNGQCGQAP